MAEEFSTQPIIFGLEGIDLKRTVDLIKPTRLARMTNVQRTEEGALVGRMGITTIQMAGAVSADMHSVIRVDDRDNTGVAFHKYVCGVGTTYYWGNDAALALVAGFPPLTAPSGAPVTMVPVDIQSAPNTDERPHVLICPSDFTGSRVKVRVKDGLATSLSPVAPADLVPPFPSTLPNVVLAAENKTTIDNCDAAGWTNNAGTGGAPANAADAVIKKEGAASLKLTSNAGAAPANYYNNWNKANVLNLNQFPGPITATDDDIIHLWIRTDRPDLISEFRIYFVVTAAFDVNTVPGTSATLNTDAYYKSIRPSDFTPVYEVSASTIPTSSTAVSTGGTLSSLPTITDDRSSTAPIVEQQEASRRASVAIGGGRGSWQEVGIVGFPLRRGDFSRVGTDSTRTWANVTGLVLLAQINTNAAVNVWLDDIYMTGGSGPDTSALGATQYDYRCTNVDSRTGEESNPSAIMFAAAPVGNRPLDSLRRSITVTPNSALNASYRQNIYRRGGTLGNNWYFLGQNTADGGAFTDSASDLQIVASRTLDIDNDAVLLITSLWGPVNGIMFGCGIVGSEGDLVWSKVDAPHAWPAAYTFTVCSASEELMSGFLAGGQAWVFSRERLFTVSPDLSNAALVQVTPTQCKKGLVDRFAFAVYKGGVFFCQKDGIYFTPGPGGPEQNISDDTILSLFRGEHKNGYQPIDWNHSPVMRMEVHESELWILFQGLGTIEYGSAIGIISDGIGPATGALGSFGWALLCNDDFNASVGPVQADVNGNFSFPSVPVGTYTLILWDNLVTAYRIDPGSVVVDVGIETNIGTNPLNLAGVHPECSGAGPPLPGEPSSPQVWIYNTIYSFWRHHSYATAPSVFKSYSGFTAGEGSRLLVGGATNATLGYIPSAQVESQDYGAQMSAITIRTGALDQGLPRVSKLYGDAYIDVDDKGNGGVTITPYINNEAQALTPTTLTPVGTGRERFYIPIDEILARNISLNIAWTPTNGAALDQPIIYQGGVSFTPQPDTTETRVTNWDTQGRLNDKWVKGVLFEVDTGGLAKSVNLLADGVVQQNISVLASGRKVLQFSFPQFRGRILRLAPADTVQWIVYDFRWIFDEEPLSLMRWESQEVDHGFHGQQVPLYGHISIRSVAPVTLTLTAFRQDGTFTTKTYVLPSTAGAKTKLHVMFEAQRGVLFKYLFTSAEVPFWLYREESTVRIQPWGIADPIETAPFGNDDLNVPLRNMMDAGIASARSGAGHR